MISFLKSRNIIAILSDMSEMAYRISLLLIFMFMVGCTEKDEGGEGPIIQLIAGNDLISSDTIIAPGQLMQFKVSATKGKL